MKVVTLTPLGTCLGVVIPTDFIRALGWARGDKLGVFIKDGNVTFRNSSQRAARFTREFRARRDQNIQADAR